MQTADQSKKGPDPTAPPPYPGGGMMSQGQTGSYAGGFVAPPVDPGYNGAPPQQGYPPQNPGYPAAGGNMVSGGYDSDVEGGGGAFSNGGYSGFSDKAIRRAFIRKVYGVLTAQLLLTFGIIMFFNHVPGMREYARHQGQWMYWVGFVVTMVCMIAMVCCEGPRRKAPMNYIFLGIFTAAEGFMLGTLTVKFETESIWIAIVITVGVTLGLTIFAFQTKYDFTACGGMLCALLMAFIIAGFFMAFMPKTKWTFIGYGAVGALIFSLYIIYDTQLMMGGKHKYSLDPEEYVFAALNIYLDVINLFLYILMIVGGSREG